LDEAEGGAELRDERRGAGRGLGVAVHGQERATANATLAALAGVAASAGDDPFQDLPGMPSPAEGAVEEDGSRPGLEDLY
jgi:hypothetical protein